MGAAGEDDQVGTRAPELLAPVVHRGEQGRPVPRPFERRVDPHGGLQVVHRDEDAGGGAHGWPVFLPESRSLACATSGATTANPSFTPPGEPGRFTINAFAR